MQLDLEVKNYIIVQKKEREPIDFLSKKKVFFTISLVLIAAGVITIGVNAGRGKGAFAYSLEFQGGTSTNVTFDKDYSIDEIDKGNCSGCRKGNWR